MLIYKPDLSVHLFTPYQQPILLNNPYIALITIALYHSLLFDINLCYA